MLQEPEWRFPCRLWRTTQQRRCFPAACGESYGGAGTHTAACGGTHAAGGGYVPKDLQPFQEQALMTRSASHGEPTQEQAYPDGLQTVEDSLWSRRKMRGGRSSTDELQ